MTLKGTPAFGGGTIRGEDSKKRKEKGFAVKEREKRRKKKEKKEKKEREKGKKLRLENLF
jgi:hypothetical protein